MDLQARKDTVRRLVLAKRARSTPAERDARAAAIVARIQTLPELTNATTVLSFVPHLSEPPIGSLLEAVLGSGKTLLLPYVADDGALRAASVASLAELEPGFRGIHEPRARMPVDPSAADVVVVPGVAFDARGNRLGYGGGFYDSFLRACGSVPRIGVCFELQLVDKVPTDERDERVDVVVTEERVLRVDPEISRLH